MATNGVRTTFLGRARLGAPRCNPADPVNNICRFFGTSASAPHVAAVVALMKQCADQAGVLLDQQRAETLLERSATPGEGSPQAQGAGLVNAVGAVGAVTRGAYPLP